MPVHVCKHVPGPWLNVHRHRRGDSRINIVTDALEFHRVAIENGVAGHGVAVTLHADTSGVNHPRHANFEVERHVGVPNTQYIEFQVGHTRCPCGGVRRDVLIEWIPRRGVNHTEPFAPQIKQMQCRQFTEVASLVVAGRVAIVR
jgi:hypothetical protein